MQIVIELHYYCGSPSLRRGEFYVNTRAYRENHHLEAARIALDFFKQIRRESLTEVKLEKIIYNSEYDITELVKDLEWERQRRIEQEYDDLPF